jgi:hypothetical protein
MKNGLRMKVEANNNLQFLLHVTLFCFLVVSGLMAQTVSTGAIAGKVVGTNAAAIAGATVTAVEESSRRVFTTATDVGGAYSFTQLPAGSYTVRFAAPGYAATEVRAVPVSAGEGLTVNQSLTPGLEGNVAVAQWTPVASATEGSTAKEIPLASRNYTQAAGLAAGVSSQVNNATTVGINTQVVQVGSGNTNNYLMDGATVATFPGPPTSPGIPNPDAIGSHNVESWSYDAGTARFSGANIGADTKSGTSQFHGTFFEFVRNDIFNANDFFIKRAGLPKPTLKQNQFGVTFGGPILNKRLFFFASYQGTRQTNGYAASGFSPDVVLPPLPAARTAAAVGAALCPANHSSAGPNSPYHTVNGGVQVACDGSNISSVSLNMLNLKLPNGSYYIPGSGTGGFASVPFSSPAKFEENQFILNTDLVLSSRNTLTEKFFYTNDPQLSYFTGGSNTLPGAPSNVFSKNIDAVLKLTTVLSTSLANDLRVSGQHYLSGATPNLQFTNSEVGIASVVPQFDMLDIINILGVFSIEGNGVWSSTSLNQYQAADQISWTHGRHTVRTGFEVERRQENSQTLGDTIGQLNIFSFADFLLGLPGCPPSAASCSAANPVVNGITTNGSSFSNIYQSAGPAGYAAMVTGANGINHAYRYSDYAGFVHDNFKLASRLTLNAGIRWQYFSFTSDSSGNLTNFWPSLTTAWQAPPPAGTYQGWVVPSNFKGTLAPGVYRNPRRSVLPDGAPLIDFAPRFGFAWQPLKSSILAVHGGYGLFFDRLEPSILTQQSDATLPFATPVGSTGAANYQASLEQPFQPETLGWGAPRTVDFPAQTTSNLNVRALDEQLNVPLTQKWNLEVQLQLPSDWGASVGYAGAHSVHLQNSDREINGAVLASVESPVNGLTANTVGNAFFRVPYLGISPSGLDVEQTAASTKYDALLATVRKRFRYGAQAQAVYTFSKTLSTFSGNQGLGMNSNDPLNARQQYGPFAHAAPQRLAVNYSWDLPYKGAGIEGRVLGNWGLSGATIVQSGMPMTVTDSRGGTIYGNAGMSRAQFCPGMGAGNAASAGSLRQRINGFFNSSAFCATPVIGDGNGYGNSSVGMILGPGQDNTDFSVNKNVAIRDSKLELRAEFFNAFNHAQFNNPDSEVTHGAHFGLITGASVNPRLIQFAAKYSF